MRALAALLAACLAWTALPLAAAEPTPGVSASVDRIVPEAWETNDYIGYDEGRAYLEAIAASAGDYVEVIEVGESVGWDNVAGGHDTFQVLAVEVTNEASAVPRGEKQVVAFQLSIHGNEKGGREGGFRVIEDLVVPRLYGEDYRALLDDTIVVFTFPNVDGWRHEEAAYMQNCPGDGPCQSTGFIRGNGHWQDLNRDWPTQGWYQTEFGRENALSEPEISALQGYLGQFRGRTVSAADIHGMLSPADGGVTPAGALPVPFLGGDGGNGARGMCLPENPLGVECAVKEGHFVLGMVRGYQADPANMLRDVQLAQQSKDALIAMANERVPYWTNAPNLGAFGGEFMEYGTVWDTLGYSDSGFTGLWFAQALGASGVDYELSYNHIVFDNHYVPEMNAIHVESVRTIVRAYLDRAMERTVPLLTPAEPVAWLDNPAGVAGVAPAAQDGAHRDAPEDDAYEVQRTSNPQQFWRDLARYAAPGSIGPIDVAGLAGGRLAARQLVVTGDAWDLLAANPQAVAGVRAFVEGGGRLLLTDSALRGLEALGLAGAAERGVAYMGYVDLDFEHPLAADVRSLAHQTYEGIPLGYGIADDASPVWTVPADSLEGGEVVGTSLGDDARAAMGVVPLGSGEVVFLGALLPPANPEEYHPYGLADYAVSATGYTLVYNILGITLEEREGPAPDALGAVQPPARVPGVEALGLVMALGASAALVQRRRRA